ncbi:MAG TPA: DUF364 domain-containing protein [Spirochaetota bacterium]|nr:DUF364 domain-containing protein [Spirochaetota bacterium]HPI87797.1 DUF364 domain-containing protein [Spirochaetota bacterium]HPR47027.1 DUF364 domain-containing protein [Spirochaetota bacterium]
MLDQLIKTLSSSDKNLKLQRVVLGLGYIAVQLENGSTGISANIIHERKTTCTVFPKAGMLRGATVEEILAMSAKEDLLCRALGLASVNAIVNVEGCGSTEDVFEQINLKGTERVVMIGLIEPVVVMLKKKGCSISVFENRNVGNALVHSPDELASACTAADIIIITATSIINNSIGSILQSAAGSRDVVLMGPSTPMSGKAFMSTPVTHLAGSQVTDPEKALEVIMEGGGTQKLYQTGAMIKVHRLIS